MAQLSTEWTIALALIPTLVSLVMLIGGYIYGMGKMRAKMATKGDLEKTKKELYDHCNSYQSRCSGEVGKKIDELKTLVIDLHEKQSKRIELMDDKREDAKDENHEEVKKLNSAISRIEGHLDAMRNGRNHLPGIERMVNSG